MKLFIYIFAVQAIFCNTFIVQINIVTTVTFPNIVQPYILGMAGFHAAAMMMLYVSVKIRVTHCIKQYY